jgi:cell wall-associated NlpC family hydrolase
MIPHWVQPYVGVPFKEKGRDRSGWDCWGCLSVALHEQRGIEVPSYTEGYATTQDRDEIAAMMRGEIARQWQPVDESDVQPFDAITLRILGMPMHCGLVIAPGLFLHALRGIGTVVERWDSLLWRKRVMGFVRWHPS